MECPAVSDQSSNSHYVTSVGCPAMSDQSRGSLYVTVTELLQLKEELKEELEAIQRKLQHLLFIYLFLIFLILLLCYFLVRQLRHLPAQIMSYLQAQMLANGRDLAVRNATAENANRSHGNTRSLRVYTAYSEDSDSLPPYDSASEDSTSLQPYSPSLVSRTSSEFAHRINACLDDAPSLSSFDQSETFLKRSFDSISIDSGSETLLGESTDDSLTQDFSGPFLKAPIGSISTQDGSEKFSRVRTFNISTQEASETQQKVPERSNPTHDKLQDLLRENNSNTLPCLDKELNVNTASFTGDMHGNKRERKSHSQIEVNWDRDVPPQPSNENTFDFYIGNFKSLIKSDNIKIGPPKRIDKLKSSVHGQVLFLRNGKLSVWMCGRHPSEKGSQPPECTLKVKATIADPRGQLRDLMVGEATWTFYENNFTYKGKWEKHVGAIDCELVIRQRGYDVLIRYVVEVSYR